MVSGLIWLKIVVCRHIPVSTAVTFQVFTKHVKFYNLLARLVAYQKWLWSKDFNLFPKFEGKLRGHQYASGDDVVDCLTLDVQKTKRGVCPSRL
jgi:hypothetical protein